MTPITSTSPVLCSQVGRRPPVFSANPEDAADTEALDAKRVLLVEDEAFIAFDLTHALEAVGAVVTHARTLEEAMDVARAGRFDAAILDVTLSATQTCRPVAEMLDASGTPYLLHSGDLDRQGEVLASLDAPVVAKPATARHVVLELAKVVQASRPH